MTHSNLYRSKQRRTSHINLWKRLNREREFNKNHGRIFAITVILIGLILGGVTLSGGPLFHSMIANPNYSSNHHDPIVPLFTFCDQKFDLSQYNSRLSSIPFHGGCGTDELQLNPNSTTSAIAIIKTPITLDQAGGKNLYFIKDMQWNTNPAGPFSDAAFYLTTNSTLPSSRTYNPTNDKSVFFVGMWEATSATSEGVFYFIKDGGDTNTLISESHGCNSGSASSLVCGPTFTPGGNLPGTDAYLQIILNYTGITTSQAISTISVAGTSGSSSSTVNDYKLPPTFFQANTFYLGFWDNSNNPSAIFRDNGIPPSQNICCAGTSGNTELIGLYSPPISTVVNTPPNLDTGGFFGPIIRALIQIGVFILSNVISFFSYVYSLIVPLVAGLATILDSALITILNAFGSIFGDNHLGTDVNNFFTNVLGWFTNIFETALLVWASVLGLLNNIINILQAFFIPADPFLNFLVIFFATLSGLPTLLATIWSDIMYFYVNGSFTIQMVLIGYYVFGIYEVYMRGTKGFMEWLKFSELIFLGTFHASYWFIKESYDVIVKLKQLIFGNTVSPVKVLGTG